VITASSCPQAWLEPLKVLFTDIGLESEEYSRAELIGFIFSKFSSREVSAYDIEKRQAMSCQCSKASQLGLWLSLLAVSYKHTQDVLLFTSKTAKSPSIDEASGLRE
jgi:hypothetical protein